MPTSISRKIGIGHPEKLTFNPELPAKNGSFFLNQPVEIGQIFIGAICQIFMGAVGQTALPIDTWGEIYRFTNGCTKDCPVAVLICANQEPAGRLPIGKLAPSSVTTG
jgi:hypothetical protein